MSNVNSQLTLRARADTQDAERRLTSLTSVVVLLNQGWDLATRIARLAGAALTATTGAALEQERVMTRLQVAVESTGIVYAEQADRLGAFIVEQQRFTRFGDD